jgi:hypothetical protein
MLKRRSARLAARALIRRFALPSPVNGRRKRIRASGGIVLYLATDMGESCVLRLALLDRRKG